MAGLKEMNANAVSLVPYTFMPQHDDANFLRLNRSPGGENDQGIIHSAYQAKMQGMSTLLKPQVWIGSAWPGEVKMDSEEEWQDFFEYYYRWIRHYAFLAEIHEFDILSVGVEFTHATLTHGAEWKAIIAKLRGIYQGSLTYSANWGDEFEKISFWSELDYIGIDCYYPLSHDESADLPALQKGANDNLNKIGKIAERENKQVLFTEIGFRSVKGPWIAPYDESNGRPANAEHQDRAYQAFLSQLDNRPWMKGIYFWKWPIVREEIDPTSDRRFVPQGKPAETTIRKYFEESF